MLGLGFSKIIFTILLVMFVFLLFNYLNKSLNFKKSKMKNNNKIFNAKFCEKCRNYISTRVNLDCNINNCPWS